MNFRIAGDAATIGQAELIVEHAEGEDEKLKPDAELVKYARTAASTIASKLGGSKELHAEINGHQSKGRGFQPAHLIVTVSRLDPKR